MTYPPLSWAAHRARFARSCDRTLRQSTVTHRALLLNEDRRVRFGRAGNGPLAAGEVAVRPLVAGLCGRTGR